MQKGKEGGVLTRKSPQSPKTPVQYIKENRDPRPWYVRSPIAEKSSLASHAKLPSHSDADVVSVPSPTVKVGDVYRVKRTRLIRAIHEVLSKTSRVSQRIPGVVQAIQNLTQATNDGLLISAMLPLLRNALAAASSARQYQEGQFVYNLVAELVQDEAGRFGEKYLHIMDSELDLGTGLSFYSEKQMQDVVASQQQRAVQILKEIQSEKEIELASKKQYSNTYLQSLVVEHALLQMNIDYLDEFDAPDEAIQVIDHKLNNGSQVPHSSTIEYQRDFLLMPRVSPLRFAVINAYRIFQMEQERLEEKELVEQAGALIRELQLDIFHVNNTKEIVADFVQGKSLPNLIEQEKFVHEDAIPELVVKARSGDRAELELLIRAHYQVAAWGAFLAKDEQTMAELMQADKQRRSGTLAIPSIGADHPAQILLSPVTKKLTDYARPQDTVLSSDLAQVLRDLKSSIDELVQKFASDPLQKGEQEALENLRKCTDKPMRFSGIHTLILTALPLAKKHDREEYKGFLGIGLFGGYTSYTSSLAIEIERLLDNKTGRTGELLVQAWEEKLGCAADSKLFSYKKMQAVIDRSTSRLLQLQESRSSQRKQVANTRNNLGRLQTERMIAQRGMLDMTKKLMDKGVDMSNMSMSLSMSMSGNVELPPSDSCEYQRDILLPKVLSKQRLAIVLTYRIYQMRCMIKEDREQAAIADKFIGALQKDFLHQVATESLAQQALQFYKKLPDLIGDAASLDDKKPSWVSRAIDHPTEQQKYRKKVLTVHYQCRKSDAKFLVPDQKLADSFKEKVSHSSVSTSRVDSTPQHRNMSLNQGGSK